MHATLYTLNRPQALTRSGFHQPPRVDLQADVMGWTEALVAATRTNAELMRLDEVCGTVEAGKSADLLVVAGDPTRDPGLLTNPENIRLIMQSGHPYKNDLASR